MRFTLATFALLTAVVSASANILARQTLPDCATKCVSTANFDGCQSTDNGCLCRSQKFVESATTCILSTCKGSDLTTSIAFAQQMCLSVGVTLTSTPVITSTSPSTSSTGSSKPSGSATSAAASSPSPSKTGAASSLNANSAFMGVAAVGLAALAF